MANKAKTHDNGTVRRFLEGYSCVSELCEEHPRTDDIFAGVLGLRSPGDGSTRALSRSVVFGILQHCETINVTSIEWLANGSYAYATLAKYAALARNVSKAHEVFIRKLQDADTASTVGASRRDLDAVYAAELRGLGLA